ncbi:MAG: fimbria/pilus periplasmic chaperone [Proteobacteria bacterium]|nr:fimbria/pilus periplasmic chaperone [Pseudomonadota bacterium]
MPKSFIFPLWRGFLGCCITAFFSTAVQATGVQPDTTIVLLSAGEGQTQMAVKNTETLPLLMNVAVQDLPGSESLTVLPLPQVSRLEPNGRQVVRFVLTEPAGGISKQYLKRVSFEGIPPRNPEEGKAKITLNVRQTIPMVISPKGLEQHPEPWRKLEIVRAGADALQVRNDSPFVVRMKADAQLKPMNAEVALLKDSYVLPGEKVTVTLPKDVKAAQVQAVRIFPASPWGFAVEPYEIKVSDNAATAS